VITVALKTHLKTRLGICVYKTLLLLRADDYWFYIKLSPTFYIKIAPMITDNNYHSVIVALLLSGLPDPVFKNKKMFFLYAEVYHNNYTKNITLTEQFEH